MARFLNQAKATQGLYLPAKCGRFMHTERTFVAPGQTIEVTDELDVELLRKLCGEGRPFVEVDPPLIADPPKPRPKLCANARCRAPLDSSSTSRFCSDACLMENLQRSMAATAARRF